MGRRSDRQVYEYNRICNEETLELILAEIRYIEHHARAATARGYEQWLDALLQGVTKLREDFTGDKESNEVDKPFGYHSRQLGGYNFTSDDERS